MPRSIFGKAERINRKAENMVELGPVLYKTEAKLYAVGPALEVNSLRQCLQDQKDTKIDNSD